MRLHMHIRISKITSNNNNNHKNAYKTCTENWRERHRHRHQRPAAINAPFIIFLFVNFVFVCHANAASERSLQQLTQSSWPQAAPAPISVGDPKTLQQLSERNFLVGIASVGAQHNRAACGRELAALLKAITNKETWSLKGERFDSESLYHFTPSFSFALKFN